MTGAEFTYVGWLLGTLGVLLLISALLGRTGERFGLPIIFMFLALGMVAGSQGVMGIAFNDYTLAFRAGTAALVLILLDGGFNTSLSAIRQGVGPALVLATVGVLLTAAMVAGCALLLGLPLAEAMLLGAVVSSTDAAAVFAVLRGSGLSLQSHVRSTIELEAGVNDPMAVVLTMATTGFLLGRISEPSAVAIGIPVQLVVGLAVGLVSGYALRLLLGRVRLPTAGLYVVATLGAGLLSFGLATLLNGSGFLAVFVAAVVLGNGPLPYRSGLARIHDALAWLSQVVMFLMLGLLVFPSRLLEVAGVGILITLFLNFIARPLAVVLCLLPFRFTWREVAYVGWVGLRGAVPIILATFPVLSGVEGAGNVFNIVFFVVAMNAVLPGMTIPWATRRFRVDAPETPSPPALLEINSTRPLSGELISFFITEPLAVCGAALADIEFPPAAAAMLVIREGDLVAARGQTVLQPGDHVYVFCRTEDRPYIELLFGRPQQA